MVAKSQPPRIDDIPSHIKFCQKWGGGKDMHFLTRSLEYIEGKMRVDRIVSGGFIGKLASLKVDPNELIPHTVHACLLAQAVLDGPKSGNEGNAITLAMISSLTTTKKAMAQQVNATIARCFQVATTHEEALHVGDMAVQCVRYMFEIDSPYKDSGIDQISAEFINRVTGAPTPATASKDTPDAAEASTTIDFLSGGQTTAGKILTRNAGFNIKDLVEPKKSTNTESQYIIATMNDDGSVGLNPILDDGNVKRGEVVIVKRKTFLSDYKLCNKRKQLLEGYPSNIANVSNAKVTEFMIKNAIGVAMHKMMADHRCPVTFRLQSKPSQKVFALGRADIGKVILVPMTHKIDLLGDGAEVPVHSTLSSPVVCSGKTFLLRKCIEAEWVAEYWAMRTTTDLSSSNFKLEAIIEEVIVSESKTIKVSIKCAVNRKALAAGNEAVLYRPLSQKEIAAEAAANAKANSNAEEPVAKKARR